MKITVNGDPQDLTETTTIGDLVKALNLSDRRIAVEVNEELIPRSLHREHNLKDGDQVEIVHAIGGG